MPGGGGRGGGKPSVGVRVRIRVTVRVGVRVGVRGRGLGLGVANLGVAAHEGILVDVPDVLVPVPRGEVLGEARRDLAHPRHHLHEHLEDVLVVGDLRVEGRVRVRVRVRGRVRVTVRVRG